MNFESIKWQFNRLTSMNINEVAYRLINKWRVKKLNQSNCFKLFKKDTDTIHYFLKNNEFDIDDCYLDTLPKENGFELYGVKIFLKNIVWHKDYVANYEYPKSHISKIKLHSYADREVKNILEIHRLHFLVDFALKYHITGKREDLDIVIDTIKSWINNNPYPYGMGWVSPTIVSKRLICLLFIWNILDLNVHAELKEFRITLIKSFENHITLIKNTLSLYSSANNHLTAELVGMFSVLRSCVGNLTPNGESLLKSTTEELETLISEQNFKDGKNKESGFGYQYQVTDWFYLAYLIDLRSNRPQLSKDYGTQLQNMFKFFRSCFDEYGNFFDYGDRDNFHVLPFKFKTSKFAFIQLLESGSKSFNDPSLVIPGIANKKEAYNFRNKILFGRDFKVVKRCKNWNETRRYEESGHIVSHFKDNYDNKIYFHFRSGDFGFLSIAAHSHSDLNSFYLSVNGQPVFIDPGTYCYRKDPEFRNYFRSAKAHNTVCVNGQNHAIAYGFNHWHNKQGLGAKVMDYSDSEEILKFSSKVCFPDKTVHYRHVTLDKKRFKLEIVDEIKGSANIKGELYLHLAPELSFVDNKIKLADSKRVCIEDDIKFSISKGQKNSEISGWYSPEFSEKLSSETLCADLSKVGKNKILIKIEER